MSFYICANCGYGSASWLGRCPDCNEFNTLKKQAEDFSKNIFPKRKNESVKKLQLTPLNKIINTKNERLKTGLFEFDRVLGGGIVPKEVILLSGEPGVGKSTLLLQTLKNVKSVYISGEETAEQVKDRAVRLGVNQNRFLFSNEQQIEGIIEGIDEIADKVDILVIDSIQTIYSKAVDSASGTVSQLKECTSKLIYLAKNTGIAVIIIGHITKVGEIAGPKTIEHAVDCVLNFEGEKISNYRILRSSKNRYGPTDEIGIFEMKKTGLTEISNPLVFLDNKDELEVGKAIIGIVEGKRSLFFEIQTLVTPTILPIPRRVVNGVDYNKVLLLLAVIRKFLNIPLDKYDIYINVVGGVDIKSTSSDLGIIASLMSSIKNIPIPKKTVFTGEVGLLGEIRKTNFDNKIIVEARRLGFKNIYSSLNLKHIKSLKSLIGK